ncbi:hypothetical protein RG47T_4606 [Mucilaginibacter polytrichastri]|uniref:Uncharacterized protein n=1 Tax=Mucilaginibacter polytrichastri TaxID=1302689 RepID=A0A1Q6A540_9SPHI|nr:hypothetical protein RG47T_4606 [Mucilaginibacter polytrichastri]
MVWMPRKNRIHNPLIINKNQLSIFYNICIDKYYTPSK